MKDSYLGNDFFSNFKKELYATTKELFSTDAETKSVNTVLRSAKQPPTAKEAAAGEQAEEPERSGETAVMVVDQPQTTWEQISSRLQEAPIIQGILGQAQKVAKSDVGKAAKGAQTKISDATEDAREFWETSQNP